MRSRDYAACVGFIGPAASCMLQIMADNFISSAMNEQSHECVKAGERDW